MPVNRCGIFLLIALSVVAIPGPHAAGQSASEAAPATLATARDSLIRSFAAENKRGTFLFYTQAYGPRGHRVDFNGSIFARVDNFQADGCELKIKSEIVDRYSGSIGNGSVGRTQNKYFTEVDFTMTPKTAANLKIVDARPVRQLTVGTNAVCSGNMQCNLTWIKVSAEHRAIHLSEITNDVADYDGEVKDFEGLVDQFFLPVSSAEAGDELILEMRTLARVCTR